MLHELHVRDLALIKEAWLEFGPGMTVLTGETGAGKTALLGALKLLMGERADSQSVRAGEAEALVEGVFSAADVEVIAKRRVSADGRSRCQLGGEMATVGMLAEQIGPLVDLHGQHEHQALLAASTHLGYLDRWAGARVGELLQAYERSRDEYASTVSELRELEAALASAERDRAYLEFVVNEIDSVAPVSGEDDALEARLPTLRNAERLTETADRVATSLRGEGGALDRIAVAAASLDKVAGISPELDAIAQRLAETQVLVDEAGMAARAFRDGLSHDQGALDQAMSRLSELTRIMKKYGPTLDEVIQTRDRARLSLGSSEAAQDLLAEASERVRLAEDALRTSADCLTACRRQAAPGFVAALAEATADLSMDGASFDVAFTELPFESWTAEGPCRVEFLYSPASGQPARPLARIASGGEVSRVMLALKGVLGQADHVETLVFDEVDAGIGGGVAHAVGRRLASLAKTHQVIVVTHLAQVAAYADTHLVVTKQSPDGLAQTTVAPVSGEERVHEIARMLSGDTSQVSLAHASELLASASQVEAA